MADQPFLDYAGLAAFKELLNGVDIVTATGDGAAYTAAIPGVTELKKGIVITIIPDKTSTETIPTLNVNGLGAKNIKQRLTLNNSLTAEAATETWMVANKPVILQFDGTQWVNIAGRPSATSLYGAVPIESGGTDGRTLAEARTNLGIVTTVNNLLDNSDFTNPVNQRGVSHVANTQEYVARTIDRWWLWYNGDSFTLENGHITVVGKLFQILESYKPNTVYTMAVKHLDGTITIRSHTFESGVEETAVNDFFLVDGQTRIQINSGDYLWAALYEGEYTVDTLPEYQPKGYTTELRECRRYLRPLFRGNSYEYIYPGQAYKATDAMVSIPLEVPMRVAPSIERIGAIGNFGVTNATMSIQAATAVEVNRCTETAIILHIMTAGGLVAGNTTMFSCRTEGSRMFLNAEL